MFCPKCKSEYVDGIKICADCNISLVDELESDELQNEYLKFVTVFQSSDPCLLALAKSILDDSKIRYFVFNENVQDLIGGRFIGLNSVIGPVEIRVSIEDSDTAINLLKELT